VRRSLSLRVFAFRKRPKLSHEEKSVLLWHNLMCENFVSQQSLCVFLSVDVVQINDGLASQAGGGKGGVE